MTVPECIFAAGWPRTVAAARRAGRPVALLFDYDGTLTPIVRHPSLARLGPEDRARLARLAAVPGVSVGFVSGRALDELRGLIGLDGVVYAGSGGAEVLSAAGRFTDPRAGEFAAVLDVLQDHLVRVLARYPGTWAERKPVGISLHYRGLLPLMAVTFRLEVAKITGELPWVRQRIVSQAIEITPAGGWDKGTAVEMILAESDPATFPVFIGDAANDAEAMAVTNARGGLSVGVGADAPAEARVRVGGPREVAVDLDELTADFLGLAPAAAPCETPAPAEKPGVMIVEPDVVVMRKLTAELGEMGWRVCEVSDPAAAVPAMRGHEADIQVALVDLQLPGFQAGKTLAALEDAHPALVRCGLTADASPYAAAAVRRLTDRPVFTSPYAADAMDRELRRLVAERDAV